MNQEKEQTETEKQMQEAFNQIAMLLTSHAALSGESKELNYHKGFITSNNGGTYMIGMFHISGPKVSLERPEIEKV